MRDPQRRAVRGRELQAVVGPVFGDPALGQAPGRCADQGVARSEVDDLNAPDPVVRQAGESLLQDVPDLQAVRGPPPQGLGHGENLAFDPAQFALDPGPDRLGDDHLLGVELIGHDGAHLLRGPDPEQDARRYQDDDGDAHAGHDDPAGRCLLGEVEVHDGFQKAA